MKTNIKKSAMPLLAKPSPVGQIKTRNTTANKTGCFNFRTPKCNSITILKNEDYNKLSF